MAFKPGPDPDAVPSRAQVTRAQAQQAYHEHSHHGAVIPDAGMPGLRASVAAAISYEPPYAALDYYPSDGLSYPPAPSYYHSFGSLETTQCRPTTSFSSPSLQHGVFFVNDNDDHYASQFSASHHPPQLPQKHHQHQEQEHTGASALPTALSAHSSRPDPRCGGTRTTTASDQLEAPAAAQLPRLAPRPPATTAAPTGTANINTNNDNNINNDNNDNSNNNNNNQQQSHALHDPITDPDRWAAVQAVLALSQASPASAYHPTGVSSRRRSPRCCGCGCECQCRCRCQCLFQFVPTTAPGSTEAGAGDDDLNDDDDVQDVDVDVEEWWRRRYFGDGLADSAQAADGAGDDRLMGIGAGFDEAAMQAWRMAWIEESEWESSPEEAAEGREGV